MLVTELVRIDIYAKLQKNEQTKRNINIYKE